MFVIYFLTNPGCFTIIPTAVLYQVDSQEDGSGYILSLEWLVWCIQFDFTRAYQT